MIFQKYMRLCLPLLLLACGGDMQDVSKHSSTLPLHGVESSAATALSPAAWELDGPRLAPSPRPPKNLRLDGCFPSPICPGTPAPDWRLVDVHPKSSGYQTRYGMDAFRGQVTVIALLAAWCGYCRGQAEGLEKLRQELEDEGHNINVAIVNIYNGEEYQDSMLYQKNNDGETELDDEGNPVFRINFPMLQDTRDDYVWGVLMGNKDDFYIYDEQGVLTQYLRHGGPVNTYLSGQRGFKNLKNAILNTVGAAGE